MYNLTPEQPLDPSLSSMIHRSVTCPPAFARFILDPRRIRREVYFDVICNASDCQLLDEFYTTTLYSTSWLIRTFHQSEPSIGNPFQDLNNLFWLFLGSMTVPINQHETFQRSLSSLMWFLEKFPEGHPSHNYYFKPNMFNYGVLKW